MTPELLPPPRTLASLPERPIVRVGLGLTAYLKDEDAWARRHAAALLSDFVDSRWGRSLRWYTTSILTTYRALDDADRRELVTAVAAEGFRGVRPLFQLRLGDIPGAPDVGFVYREGTAGSPHGAYLQIQLPPWAPPAELLHWATAITEKYPVRSLVGGFEARFDPCAVWTAFAIVFRWARRYWGLDVQEPERFSPHARHGLPGANWLNYVDAEHAAALDLERILEGAWQHGAQTSKLRAGVMIRCGDEPSIGDVNQMTLPASIAEVSTALAHRSPLGRMSLPGPFAQDGRTDAWLCRFADPAGWNAAS